MVPCLGEPPRSFFIHFISSLLYHVTGTPPWLLRPVKASTSSELYPDYFWLPFLFHLPQALRFWVGSFYTQAFFTLCSFTEILTNIYQGFPGTQQFFLDVCRALYWSWNHGTGLSVCLIHSNPLSLCILNLYLYMPILQLFNLWWKLWWKIKISNHIIQQPWKYKAPATLISNHKF